MRDIPQDQYNVFYKLNKTTGKRRLIQEPSPQLKLQQKSLINIYEEFPFHSSCTSRKGFGPIDAAKPHFEAKFLLKVDISDCYQNVELHKVTKIILNTNIPNALKDYMIFNLKLCFIEHKGKIILPTGAPTSPILCNIALSKIDEDISELAFKYNYSYTRYMDDLSLSTKDEERRWNLIDDVSNVLSCEGYPINKQKTKWYGRGNNDAKIVAGINLETKSKRSMKRMLRARLNLLALARKPFDSKTTGYLSYIKSIDESTYQYFINYYNKRLNRKKKLYKSSTLNI